MTGALTLPGADPSSDNHATRKRYVDQQIAVAVSSGTPGGPIDTANISDGAITTDKIADDAVTAAKLDHTGVTADSYTNADITVDENGRITAASNGSSGAGATDLGVAHNAENVSVTSSTGDDITLNAATPSVGSTPGTAGVMTDGDKEKLDGIAVGAEVNPASTDALTEGTTNLYNQDHTGDVTGSTTLTIENNAVTSAKIANNAVTSAKISDTDTQFLVDDSSTQKKVVVNDGTADVDFIVKSSGNGNLIITDGANNAVGIGTTAIAGFALTASNSAVGNSLVVYDATSQTEGGQILINKAAVNTPSNTETDSYLFDTFKDAGNTYEHGTNADLLRIVTPGTARNATTFADNGNISVTGDVFPTGDAQYDLGKSNLQWGTVYASDVNITGDLRKNGTVFGGVLSFESSAITWTAGTSGTNPVQNAFVTAAHGLGAQPDNFSVSLRCITTEHGYSVGDEVLVCSGGTYARGEYVIYADSSNVGFGFSSGTTSNPFTYVSRSSPSSTVQLSASNWKLVFRAQIF
jgi:hypothetical protein